MTTTDGLPTHLDLHLPRKIFHFLSVLAIFFCILFFDPITNWIIYFIFGIPSILFDLIRQNSGPLNEFTLKLLKPILRKSEFSKLSGATFAIMGVGLVYYIFSPMVAQLAVLFLAVGDPVASFFGLLFGKHKILGSKSFEGSLGAWIFCSIAAAIYLSSLELFPDQVFIMALVCGLIGALAELIPLGRLDDNLSQPLISALLLSTLFSFVGGPA